MVVFLGIRPGQVPEEPQPEGLLSEIINIRDDVLQFSDGLTLACDG